jgi:hypothetical protein
MMIGGNTALIDALDYWKMRSYRHMKGGKKFSSGVSLLDLVKDGDES